MIVSSDLLALNYSNINFIYTVLICVSLVNLQVTYYLNLN